MKESPSKQLPELPISPKSFPEGRPPSKLPEVPPLKSASKASPDSAAESSAAEPEKRKAVSPAIREVVGRSPIAPTLSILRGLKAGRTYELLGDSISIGRNSHCDLVLPDEVVSRNHARLRARTDGFYIEDLGSRNGTFVNGKRITEPTKLSDGDYIQVYELLLSFHLEGGSGSGSLLRSPLIQEELADWSAEDSSMEVANTDRTLPRSRRRGRSSAIIMTLDASWTGPERIEVNAETKLQAVLEITRNLGSTLDLDHVLTRILDSVFRFFPQADHGYILKSEPKGGLRPAVLKHRDRGGAPSTIRPIARTIAKQVLSEAKAILSSDVVYDQHASDIPTSVLEPEHRSMMCAPLMGPSQMPLGIIYIDTEDSLHPFGADDLDVLVCIAILAGQAMEQASVSEARYRAVVDAAADGILTINDKGVIQSVNPAIERLFGYASHELIGQPVSWLTANRENGEAPPAMGFFEPDEDDSTLGSLRETEGRRKDGSTFPLSLSVAELELGGERLLTGILQDITDRKRAEQDRLQAELVHIVWEQQRHFGQELHDSFGQELTGIRLLIDSLRQRLKNHQLPEAETAEELASLIRDAQAKMRGMARGLFPVEIFAHGLMSALEDLANTIRSSRQVECSFHCEGSVDVDSNEVATHLFRIAQEATTNAVKHSGAKHIRISLMGKGPRLVLAIQDDGSGLPPDAMNQASLASGMGLRTMKYRANVVGADLTIHSAKDPSSSDASCGTIVRCVYQRDQETEGLPL